MKVYEARTKKELKTFIRMPKDIYRNDPLWVPPIWLDENTAYSPKKNPILANSDYVLLIAVEKGRCLARCLTYVDRAFTAYYKSPIGLFGAFECSESPEAAKAIMKYSEEWLKARGMEVIRGPIHPIAENWGFLLEGDGRTPVFMTPHTPPRYISYFEEMGYGKAMDLLAYEGNADGEYRIPDRIRRFLDLLAEKKPGITVRRINMRRLMEDAEHIWRLTNTALADNWGYVPVDREVLMDMVKRLKPIADPDAIWLVEDAGTPVGYCLGFPDLNLIFKKINGNLLPFGFITLLTGVKKLKDYRLWGLAIHPDYHGMGLDVLLYASLNDALQPRGIRLEANYILENNYNIRNGLEKLGLDRVKSYRIFDKELK